MRATIRDGKIVPPNTFAEAIARRAGVVTEIARCERQVADPNRRIRFTNDADYEDWKNRALKALRLYRKEREQLETWIEGRTGDTEELLRQALPILRDVDDLDASEQELVDKIEEHFREHNDKVQDKVA